MKNRNYFFLPNWQQTRQRLMLLSLLFFSFASPLLAQTALVKDIKLGTDSSSPKKFAVIGSTLYFIAYNGTNGEELWKSDGTAAGTMMVKDINPGAPGSSPNYLTVVGSTLYFVANNGTNGVELWKSDGTATGTVMVKDIYSGSDTSSPNSLTAVGNTLYFAAFDGLIVGLKLWKSDGTATGTQMVTTTGTGTSSLTALGSTLYFVTNNGTNGAELWKSDGTSAGTVMVKDIDPGAPGSYVYYLTAMGSTLYFYANDGTNGGELWKSDGTASGTQMVKDINSGVNSSLPNFLTAVGNTLYFHADNGINGYELWKSDGTADGTVMVKDIYSGSNNSYPYYLTAVGNTLYFQADNGINGYELWKSDGTASGTQMVKDINSGNNHSLINNLAAMDGYLYFQANDGTNGVELWKSDGTTAGTQMVKDINIGTNNSSPANLTAMGSYLYFQANDGTNGAELWKSDGVVIQSTPPTITTTGTLAAFSACANTVSAEQSFTVSGSDLAANIVVTAPTGFQVSTTSGSNFGASVTLTQNGGNVATSTVFVRMAAVASSPANGDITCASTGTITRNVAASGTVTLPTVSITGTNPICVGATTTLSPTSGGTWASSNTAVATVTDAGVVTGVSGGTATFTFTQASTGCTSVATSALTVNTLPTITLGTITGVSTTATSFSIPYTATTGNQYSLTAGTPAMLNFINVPNTAFPASSPISVTIPASVFGVYNFNLTVTNTTTGCVNANIPVALTVVATPAGNNPFITRWDMSKSNNASTSLDLDVVTIGSVSYSWQQVGGIGASGTGTITNDILSLTGVPTNAIIDLSIFPTNFLRIKINHNTNAPRLTQIKQWGDVAWTSMKNAFAGCSNMTLTATDVPNLASVSDMSGMFLGCSRFNQALPAGFNTSAVTNMRYMFSGCTIYNQALPSSFNTAAVTDMSYMFNGCKAYNQALPSSFNTAAVTNMGNMFSFCEKYNQDFPSGFNTAAVTDMSGMFSFCDVFNKALPSTFNTSNVTNMRSMFDACWVFNQALPSSFNTAKVTDMALMFRECFEYTQILPSSFNTSAVTNMSYMFWRCEKYNQALPSSFNTASVTDMSYMFGYCSVYNKPLPSGFNTAAVTNMNSMFVNASLFNQTLPSSFTTAAVTDMRYMFYGAVAFNQSLASFTLNANVDLRNFIEYSNIDQPNYDATLTAFNSQNVTGRTMGAIGRKYCLAEADRNNLVKATGSGGKGWTITGDAKLCAGPTITASGTLAAFFSCPNTASNPQSFTVNGTSLSDAITVTAPTGFEVSTTSSSGFGASVTLAQSGTSVANTTIYVRMAAMASSPTNGNVTCASTGATTRNIAVSGTVGLPTITLGTISSISSMAITFIIPYTATTGNPDKYSLTAGTPAMSGFNAVTNAPLTPNAITVTVPASPANTYNFNLTISNSTTGCVSAVVQVPLTVQPAPSVSKIVAGYDFSAVLKSDGTIWAWGSGSRGTMGNGPEISVNPCAIQVGTATNWVDIAGGLDHILALKNDGTLWAWGYNMQGQLGLGDSGIWTNRNTPRQVGTDTDWKIIAAGHYHSLAIKTNGTLWAWGYNGFTQLGLSDNIDRNVPTQVGTEIDWKAISGGAVFTLALKNNGTLWSWGSYGGGIPTQVGTGTSWSAISAGGVHALTLQTNGTLWAWGDNSYGELGLGYTGNETGQTSPQQVGTDTDWKEVSATTGSSYALKTNNTLWSWGNNYLGQLGIGSTISQNTPQQIAGNNWKTATGGIYHAIALKTDDKLWAWGQNDEGELGVGDQVTYYSPLESNCNPRITTTGTLTAFAACASVASGQKSFTVNGSNLTNNITITAPAGFEISTTSGTGFATTPITLTQSGGTVTSKTIYVRMAATTSSPTNGNITCVSSGTPTQTVALSGTVVNTLPTITLGTIASVSSTATSFSIPYTATTDDPNQYSLTAGTPAMSGFVAVSNATLPSSPISVTIPTSAAGNYNFNLTVKNSNTSCVSTAVPVTLTVANPFITRWNLATGGSGTTQLTFGVATSGTVNYTWTSTTTSASGSGTITGSTATITGLPAGETIVLSIAPTNFQRFIINGGTDNLRLTAIDAWGDVAWTSMADAFNGCDNLTTATGNPILTGVTDMSSMFAGCLKFNGNITGWNTSTVKNMSRMFFRAYAFNQAIGSWNTAEVTDMSGMFFDALAFNQAIGSWNTAKVTNMSSMFIAATAFNQNLGKWTLNATVDLTSMLDFNGMDCANYSATLVGWAANANTPSGRALGADGKEYGTNAAAARTTLTTTKGWTITGHTAGSGACILAIPIINVQGNTNDIADGATTPSVTNHTDFGNVNVGSSFVRTYTIQNTGGAALTISNIVSSNTKFVIGTPKPTSVAAGASTTFTVTYTPTATGTDNATITINNNDSDKAVYDFAVTGTAPRPFITRWDLSKTGASSTALNFDVATDGSVNYTWTTVPAGTTGSGTFAGNTATITGLPAGAIIDLSIFPANFQRININGGTDKARLTQIRQWGDVAWTSMESAFYGCSNMTLTATDVPNLTGVTNMIGMFLDCSSFNQALPEGFNTDNVTDMSAMFRGCTTYNKALPSSFSTAKVIDMHQMFLDCSAYNQALPSSFNTEKVRYMNAMFSGCRAYNQALPSSFNTAAVIDMGSMFVSCSAYNQALPSSFNTAAVTDMSFMFFGCSAYNQALPSSFNTERVTNMNNMFYGCGAYNQALPSSFNTAAVTNMNGMFYGCIKYNQALPSSFSTGAVTDMISMFEGCTAFNQSLAAFQLKAGVNLDGFLNNCGMNKANYDATLTAFNAQAVTGRNMGAVGLKYCASEADRANLVNVKGWTITGDTKDCLPTITNFPASACVGSSITITGTNFTGATAVRIGGVAVTSFVVTSETKITAIMSSSTTGTISITTPYGVVESTSTLTVKTTPSIPTISGNTEICEGLGTTLTVSPSLIGEPYITYHWTGGQTGYSIIDSPLTTRTYRVAASANGCTSDSSAVFTLTVNPKPATPSITADNMNMTICNGGSVVLTGNCSTANVSFRWTTPPFISGNQTSALPSTDKRVITEPGTYKGLCESDKGCLSDEYSITIMQATDCSGLNFITITPERPAICPGQSIVMTATGCAGTLTWIDGTTTQTGASVTLSPTATTNYLVNCSKEDGSTIGSATFDLVVASNTLAVPDNVSTDKQRFKAVTTLTSDKKVGTETFTPGANVIYEAGRSITLLPGFAAEKWSVFRAEIKGCGQN